MVKTGDKATIKGKQFELTTVGQTGVDRFVEVKTPQEHRFYVPVELWDAATMDGKLLDDPAGRPVAPSGGWRMSYTDMERIARSFGPSLPEPEEKRSTFADELRALINRQSAENGSDTPDYILAEFLVDCLAAFDRTVRDRDRWYGRTPSTWEKSGFLPRTVGQAREEIGDQEGTFSSNLGKRMRGED